MTDVTPSNNDNQASEGEAPEPGRASILARIGGIAIDWVLCLIISGFFFPVAEYADAGGIERVFAGKPLATLSIWAVQHFFLVSLIGMTYGHRIAGLRVVREDGGGFPGLKAGAIRTVLLALVIPAVVWDSEGRGLHDRAAGTRLISIR
ncbi:RDD family protein [Demequina sp.]|uniref:RDD family protein n=1 Tax=Demequina sp. TaxID=2050685 RepID=UPI003D11709E